MVYIKTELGKTALQDRSLGLTPKQRSSFIMFDGKRSVDEVLKLTTALGVTADDINRLKTIGLLAQADAGVTAVIGTSAASLGAPAADMSAASTTTASGQGPTLSDQAQYAKAYLIAVHLTGSLGLRGFRLNLAVESAGDLEELKDLAPKIRQAVGAEKCRKLDEALNF